MTRGDISVIGVSGGARPFRVAASATRGYAGEPIGQNSTYTTGVTATNTVIVASDATPVIIATGATEYLVGIAAENMKVNSSGTVLVHTLSVTVPIPYCTRMRGKAEVQANVDTDTELLGRLWDLVLWDLTSGVYTIDDTATADTSGLTIVDGIPAKGTLDVTVDARAMRAEITA